MDEFTKSPKAILTANPKPQYCNLHNDQPLELYCITCSKLICRDCTYIDHSRGEHQFEFLRKVILDEQAKIKEIATPLQSLLERLQVAIKNSEAAKQAVDTRSDESKDKVRSFFKDLHKVLDDQEAKLLHNVDAITSMLHNSVDSQRKDLLSLQKQVSNCKSSALRISRSNNINELSAHIDWVDSRVTDLTNSVEHANLDPVCKGESTVWCADRRVYYTHCESLCRVSGPPHPPLCSVKGPTDHMLQSDTTPVVITVTLKDTHGVLVINQSQHLKIKSTNPKDCFYNMKVEELTGGYYNISYHPKKRKDHSIIVTWDGVVLHIEEVNVSFCIRDYAAIHQAILTISKHKSKFNNPCHIINGPNKELIVCDCSNHQVVVFNEQLQFSHVIGKGENPSGVTVDSTGHLFVAHCDDDSIKKFKMDGTLLAQFGTSGSGEGQFNSPGDLVVSKTGRLYVCDRSNNRIQVFKNNKFVFLFGGSGHRPGDLNRPKSVTLNSAETELFVADTENHRIQMYTPDGKFIYVIGNFTDIPYKLSRPHSICYTPDDHLLITSAAHVVLIFKSDGTFVTAIEGKGRFQNPAGVVMRNNGEIVISGYSNNKLVVF